MRAPFLPAESVTSLCHTLDDCRREKREALIIGAWWGCAGALVLALVVGTIAARHQERTFDKQMRLTTAQFQATLSAERERTARLREVAAVADALERSARR